MSARFELHGIFVSGPSYKVGLMLSLAGQAFDYVHVNLREGEHKRPDYVAKQRYGQVPLLLDKSNGRQLCQSAAILEYLADTIAKFGGATLDERLQAREWMFWDFDRLSSSIYRARVIKLGIRPGTPEMLEEYSGLSRVALKVLDEHLAGRSWIVGEGLTIADIDIYGAVVFAGEAGIDMVPYANIAAWMKRVEALPGFAPPASLLPHESKAAA
ncbi:glutathione S-transferase family protein [Microvirga sp. 2MCAF38]|uniref:glutathione S-transferase family protein n=1 Tax=Microvirga sp. 2MCAF38 TaxID=3232989 RepID=UPI003F9E1863